MQLSEKIKALPVQAKKLPRRDVPTEVSYDLEEGSITFPLEMFLNNLSALPGNKVGAHLPVDGIIEFRDKKSGETLRVRIFGRAAIAAERVADA